MRVGKKWARHRLRTNVKTGKARSRLRSTTRGLVTDGKGYDLTMQNCEVQLLVDVRSVTDECNRKLHIDCFERKPRGHSKNIRSP